MRTTKEIPCDFFKSAKVDGGTISGEPVTAGLTRSPILSNASKVLECKAVEIVEPGNDNIFVSGVIDTHQSKVSWGHGDEANLRIKELGDKALCGG